MVPPAESWWVALCRSEHNLEKSNGGEEDLVYRTAGSPECVKTHPWADIQLISKAHLLPYSSSQDFSLHAVEIL